MMHTTDNNENKSQSENSDLNCPTHVIIFINSLDLQNRLNLLNYKLILTNLEARRTDLVGLMMNLFYGSQEKLPICFQSSCS